MKKCRIAVLAALAALLLTACSSKTVTVFADGFTVIRHGRETCITDTSTGAEFHFTARRVKRPQNTAEATERAKMKTAADTQTLKIKYAGAVITVTVNATGETFLVRGGKR